ncbi:MAG: pilin [Candidatus Paceibacterota bacterium]
MTTILKHNKLMWAVCSTVALLAVVVGGVAPTQASAQEPGDCRADGGGGVLSGLVPCGCDTNGDDIVNGDERCDFSDIMTLIQNIITWIILFTIPVAALMFSYAGFLLISAQGDEGKIRQGKQIFGYVLTGFVFVLAAWLIVYTVASVLLDDEFLQFLE